MSLDAHDATLATCRHVPAPPPLLQHPNKLALDVTLQESVWRLLDNDDSKNTKKAHDPKMKEYFEFCRKCTQTILTSTFSNEKRCISSCTTKPSTRRRREEVRMLCVPTRDYSILPIIVK
jgi:hypothetical protein